MKTKHPKYLEKSMGKKWTILLWIVSALLMPLEQVSAQSQLDSAYKPGEWFKFRVHYGLLTAGYATIAVENGTYKGKEVYHIKGFGETTGVTGFLFNVEDYYQSWIDKETQLPYQFLRKIDEGGYTKDKLVQFDQIAHTAEVNDRKKNKVETVTVAPNIQDMVSSFYYLRNEIDPTTLQINEETHLTMFYDKENYPFRLRFLGRETINTKFGKVKCLKFRPLVLSGRVFEEEESLTLWVSDDANKMPIRIKANLVVGSLKADLEEFKGLKHSFKIVVN